MKLHLDRIVIVAVIVVVLIGMVVAYMPSPYSNGFKVWQEGEEIYYEYDANYVMDTHTIAISSALEYDITYIAVYCDESYASVNSWELQKEMFSDLEIQLSIRSFDGFGYFDAEGLENLMTTADTRSVAILFASGAIPDILYDGTDSCPLLRWIGQGGAVINISGCLGKYISIGPDEEDIVEIEGYAELFTGVSGLDDSSFNDNPRSVRATSGQNEVIQDALGINFNEYSYGISCEGLSDYLSLGYVSDTGYSCAAIYRSGEGMVINFGLTLANHPHTIHYVAQVLAAGLDYTSEIVDYDVGKTNSGTGVLDSEGKDVYVYGYVGYTRAVYGLKLML